MRVRKRGRTALNAPAVKVIEYNPGFRLVQKTPHFMFSPLVLFGPVKIHLHVPGSSGYLFHSFFAVSGNKEPSSWSAACHSQWGMPTVFVSMVKEFC